MTSLNHEEETFSAYLDRLAQDPDDDLLLADFVEAEKMIESSKGFHWRSPRLLSRAKRCLKEYYLLMRLRDKLPVVEIKDPLSLDTKGRQSMTHYIHQYRLSQITFKHLEGKRDGIGKDTSQTLYPKALISNRFVHLSIPYRLLVILLRRDALEDYSSGAFSFSDRVEQLLNGKENFIRNTSKFRAARTQSHQ